MGPPSQSVDGAMKCFIMCHCLRRNTTFKSTSSSHRRSTDLVTDPCTTPVTGRSWANRVRQRARCSASSCAIAAGMAPRASTRAIPSSWTSATSSWPPRASARNQRPPCMSCPLTRRCASLKQPEEVPLHLPQYVQPL